jgi:hypothetical protein
VSRTVREALRELQAWDLFRFCRVRSLGLEVSVARFSTVTAIRLLDLGGLLFELGCENLYLFLLLPDRCLQLLNFAIEHGLGLGILGNGLALAAVGIKSTRVHSPRRDGGRR